MPLNLHLPSLRFSQDESRAISDHHNPGYYSCYLCHWEMPNLAKHELTMHHVGDVFSMVEAGKFLDGEEVELH